MRSNTAKSTVTAFSERQNGKWMLSDEESLLIGALGETLQWALIRSSDHFPANWEVGKAPGWSIGFLAQNELQRQGWRPSEISYLQGLLNKSACGLYYATSLNDVEDKRGRRVSHNSCSISECLANNIVGSDEYQIRHVKSGCSCQFLEPDAAQIVDIILSIRVPLLQYFEDSNGEPFFSVVPYSPGMQYIVISHVWADGLGNPTGNAMGAYQIKRLAKLVKNFSDFHHAEVYFWIDSMCIPRLPSPSERTARNQGIQMMFDTFSNAFAIIVLSLDLMNYSANQADYLEAAMRIATSNWMRRLWTFQEGVMSRHLYFLFANGLKNIEDLQYLYPAAAAKSVVANAAQSFYTNLLRSRVLRREVDV